jgi:Ca-activated chloride channel homolog
MRFTWPWALTGLVAVPLLVWGYRRLLARRAARRAQLAALGLVVTAAGRRRWRRHVPVTMLITALGLLVVALARPQASVPTAHREGTVILAFDSSASMAAKDIAPDRMTAARKAAKAFVAQQPASVKVGVVSFSEGGVIMQRPTSDHAQVAAAVDRLTASGGTSIGRGIQTSLSAIAGKPVQLDPSTGTVESQGQNLGFFGSAAVVLLTDGENTAGPDPVEVAALASTAGVKVYPVGLGSAQGTVVQINGFQVATALDEPLLRQIASTTDGQFFAAADADALTRVYQSINLAWKVESRPFEVTALVALAAGLLLLLGTALSLAWVGRVI